MSGGQHPGDQGSVDRRVIVAELMAAQTIAGETVTTVVLLGQLCRAAALNLAAFGVVVGLVSDAGSAGVVASADERSADLDELQFTLGEGPSHDAFARRRPVLIADLRSSEGDAWPVYSAGALEAGVSGVFAFPLHIGASTFGIFTIYISGAGALDPQQLRMALTFAEIATEILLDADSSSPDGSLHPGVETALTYRTEIYQAQGYVMVQLGIGLPDALVLMRAHAFVNDQTLAELAALIMSGEVELAPTADN
jgi:hypothetical protein